MMSTGTCFQIGCWELLEDLQIKMLFLKMSHFTTPLEESSSVSIGPNLDEVGGHCWHMFAPAHLGSEILSSLGNKGVADLPGMG